MAANQWISVMLKLTVYALFVTNLLGRHANALSAGASNKTCQHLTPIHGSYEPQTIDSIFSVNVSTTEYGPGEHINVTIQSECGESFKGFILQARRADGNYSEPIGSFSSPPGSHAVPGCGTVGQAITQDNTSLKYSMRFEWTAPEESIGDIVMTVTFVQDFAIFWTKVRSAVIVDRNSNDSIPNDGIYGNPSPWSCSQQISSLNKTCVHSQSCLGQCVNNECSKLLSWNLEEQSAEIKFTISVLIGRGGNKWIALGFSADSQMGDDKVIECVSFEGQTKIYSSYNQDGTKRNERLQATSNLHRPDTASASLNDGIFECSFSVPVTGSIDFTHSWYILITWGNTDTDTNHKDKHSEIPFVSKETIRFLPNPSTITTTPSSAYSNTDSGIYTFWFVCLSTIISLLEGITCF